MEILNFLRNKNTVIIVRRNMVITVMPAAHKYDLEIRTANIVNAKLNIADPMETMADAIVFFSRFQIFAYVWKKMSINWLIENKHIKKLPSLFGLYAGSMIGP